MPLEAMKLTFSRLSTRRRVGARTSVQRSASCGAVVASRRPETLRTSAWALAGPSTIWNGSGMTSLLLRRTRGVVIEGDPGDVPPGGPWVVGHGAGAAVDDVESVAATARPGAVIGEIGRVPAEPVERLPVVAQQELERSVALARSVGDRVPGVRWHVPHLEAPRGIAAAAVFPDVRGQLVQHGVDDVDVGPGLVPEAGAGPEPRLEAAHDLVVGAQLDEPACP